MATINKEYTVSLQSGVTLSNTTVRIKHIETDTYVFQQIFDYPDPILINTVVPESGEFEIMLICKIGFDGKTATQAVKRVEIFA